MNPARLRCVSEGRVLVIIPAFNEVDSLPGTLAELRSAAPALDLLVVDDGSRDGTSQICRDANIRVVRHPINLGVGAALQTGLRYAVAHGYDIGVQFDADGQHDPAYLDALLAPVRQGVCDLAIGSRYVAESGYRAPVMRRIGMLLFAGVVRLAVGKRIADTTSGFRAYGRAVMAVCQHDFPKDFPDAPLLIALAWRGFRLQEVPVRMRERARGQSFYTLSMSLYYPYKNLLASLMALLQRRVQP
jgi:glycosyltransferase involved in cell wall biosynthesis